MKFGRELKTLKGLTEKEAIAALAEHVAFLQRRLEQVLTQLEKQNKG